MSETGNKNTKYAYYDGAKVILALSLVIYHYLGYIENGNVIINVIQSNFHIVVEFFFCFSGFLFYINYFERISGNEMTLLNLVNRRYTRLWPEYAISLLFLVCALMITNRTINSMYPLNVNLFISNILMLGAIINNGNPPSFINDVTWYLPPLLLSTFLVAAFIRLDVLLFSDNKSYENDRDYSKRHLLYFSAVMLIFGTIIRDLDVNTLVFNDYNARGVAGFSLGIILAVLKNDEAYCRLFKNKKLIFISAVGLLITVYAISRYNLYIVNIVRYITIPSLSVLIYNLNSVRVFLSNSLFRFLSKYTYSLYLWHGVWLRIFLEYKESFPEKFDPLSIKIIVLYFGLSLVTATVSKHFVDYLRRI